MWVKNSSIAIYRESSDLLEFCSSCFVLSPLLFFSSFFFLSHLMLRAVYVKHLCRWLFPSQHLLLQLTLDTSKSKFISNY